MRIDLTEAELQALAGLLDAAVRATGLRAVKDAALLLEKLEAAQASEPDEQNEPDSAIA